MEERIAQLFQPDVLIPSQYREIFYNGATREPEKMLMLAVLENGIHTFKKHVHAGDARFREAFDWIMDENGDWFFSFENICDVLGMDARYIRKEIMRWCERQGAGNTTNNRTAKVYLFPLKLKKEPKRTKKIRTAAHGG